MISFELGILMLDLNSFFRSIKLFFFWIRNRIYCLAGNTTTKGLSLVSYSKDDQSKKQAKPLKLSVF